MRRMNNLTNLQKEYAKDHINLVYKFLHENGLNIDEYYDIIIFAYLSSVQQYDERPELHKYEFSTIAWREMKNSLCDYYTSCNRLKRKAQLISYERASQKELSSLDELLPNRMRNTHDTVTDRLYSLEIMSYLTEKEQNVVRLKADGYSYREIADICGISFYGVNSRFVRLRKRVSKLKVL